MNKAEIDGEWPEAIRIAIIASITKEGATNEGELRPIGMLPYIYRVGMAIRREDVANWKQEMYQGPVPSSVELAWITRIQE